MKDKVIRSLESEESRIFWKSVKDGATTLKDWPEWRKAGINEGGSSLSETADPSPSQAPSDRAAHSS